MTPRGAGRLILLDIEGTLSPLAYVHEVMFPFARAGMQSFLEQNLARPEVAAALNQMAADAGSASFETWRPQTASPSDAIPWIVAHAHALMDRDVKATGLKQLQGLIWEGGFRSGALRSAIYPDVAPTLREWKNAGAQLRIYSSGSKHAQQLFFAHTEAGDLTPLLSGYYDTTTGPKKVAASYTAIANDAGFPPDAILFLSDVVEELDAARAAGFQTALIIRPGNVAPASGPTVAPASCLPPPPSPCLPLGRQDDVDTRAQNVGGRQDACTTVEEASRPSSSSAHPHFASFQQITL
jgi:enolase-phosphatase E1